MTETPADTTATDQPATASAESGQPGASQPVGQTSDPAQAPVSQVAPDAPGAAPEATEAPPADAPRHRPGGAPAASAAVTKMSGELGEVEVLGGPKSKAMWENHGWSAS
jgi:hypothetical protein